MVWRADNTFDVYIDGVKKVNNQATNNDQVSGIDRFYMNSYGDSIDYQYLDAYGDPDNDTDYDVADNLHVDWHDPYNKEEITSIKTYPIVDSILDMTTTCTCVIGINPEDITTIFTDWSARNFNKILIEDDSDNILFRGYLVKKKFTEEILTLFFSGFSVALDWKPFNKDYILEKGLVKTVPLAGTTDFLELKTDGGGAFNWTPHEWIFDQDVGLLIIDNTSNIVYKDWICTANPTTANGTEVSGDKDSLDDKNDEDTYYFKDTSTPWDAVCTIPMGANADGDEVADTNAIHKIEVIYRIGLKTDYNSVGYFPNKNLQFQISKDGVWENIFKWGGSGSIIDWSWEEGTWEVTDTNAELIKYLEDDDADNKWDLLEGLRFICEGGSHDKDVFIKIDYILIRVYYAALDISPIMYKVDDNTAEAVQNVGTTWDETGVVAEDSFRFGQNTRQVLNDLHIKSGIDFYVPGITITEDQTAYLYPDGDAGTNEWTDVAAPHWSKIDEVTPDGVAITVNQGDDDLVEIFTMGTQDIGNIGVISEVTVQLYCKDVPYTIPYPFKIYVSWDGGSTWSSEKTIVGIVSYSWCSLVEGAWTGLSYDQSHLDQLQVKIDSNDVGAGHIKYVDTLRVTITYDYIEHPFNKYMAREFKGNYCTDTLRALAQLEGCHWTEDATNDRIIISTPANFEDTTVDLTEADYDHDWEYEDACNNFYRIEVYGKAVDEIKGVAEDKTIDSPQVKVIIDDSITNNADAQEVADEKLLELKTKRPAITLTLNTVQANLNVGETVDITFARPTIAEDTYPIRKILRKKMGTTGIKTSISVGLGRTTPIEFIARTIRDTAYLVHKVQTEKLL